jgi:hypothetical protein
LNTKAKKMFGIGALVAGAVLVVFSFVIKEKVREGQEQISSAEQSVQKGKSLFGASSYTKPIGEHVMSGADRKIGEGKESIAYYTKLANILLGVGIVLIVVGGGTVFFVGKSAR